jgi:uncharacterized protein YjbI with pentapeptide repeats
MNTSRRRRALLAGLGVAVLAPIGVATGLAVADDTPAGRGGDASVRTASVETSTAGSSEAAGVQVEMMLNAERADWQPGSGGQGTLVLDEVDPRLVMMAVAPRRETVVVPVSMLTANWQKLFASTGNETNILVAAEDDGRRKLVPFRARLIEGEDSGRQLRLAVGPLQGGAHELDALGDTPVTFEGVSVVVDPSITDEIQAMWDALVAFFTDKDYELPPNPTFETDGTISYTDGFDPYTEQAATYKGPTGADVTNPADRDRVQGEIVDAVGNVLTSPFGDGLRGWALLPGNTYDGLALFDATPGVFVNGDSELRTEVTNSAFFQMNLNRLDIRNADVGGLNMRGTAAESVTIEGTAFDKVDLTGSTLGSAADGAARSTVTNSVFENVSANEVTRAPLDDNAPDRASKNPGSGFHNVDFTSVSFRNVDFANSHVESTTFQGCGLSGVDFTNARFEGRPTEVTETFEPTFDNSILENVKFDKTVVENVSFRGADFSGGGVSFDGAILRNVDFTDATGLQYIDWTKVTIDGPVYGLEPVATQLDFGEHPEYFRYLTFDGERPEVDLDTGFDIEPETGLLIDPATGVRVDRDDFSGELTPIDPTTGAQMTALNGDPLVYEGKIVYDPNDMDAAYRIDYATGELRYR